MCYDDLDERLPEAMESDGGDVAQLRAALERCRTWMSNVPTDVQLDAPVPALGGITGRELLSEF